MNYIFLFATIFVYLQCISVFSLLQNATKDVIIMVFANRAVYVAVCPVGMVNFVLYLVAHIIALIEDNVNKYKVCGNVFVIQNILEKTVARPRSKSVAMELITI